MAKLIAALPMYDWPERRAEVDAEWAAIRDRLRSGGIDAPERLIRSNAEMPAVPGGIRDSEGHLLAPDPATLPPDELDLFTLWRHPNLLFSQTCWGPMMSGLEKHVSVLAQPKDYSAYEGGEDDRYSSAIVIRGKGEDVPSPRDGEAVIPLDVIRGQRFAFNNHDSMSGLLGIKQDIDALGETLGLFRSSVETGSHRMSARLIADGTADVAAIDCRTLSLIRRFDSRIAGSLRIVGWTARRKGLPYIGNPELWRDSGQAFSFEF